MSFRHQRETSKKLQGSHPNSGWCYKRAGCSAQHRVTHIKLTKRQLKCKAGSPPSRHRRPPRTSISRLLVVDVYVSGGKRTGTRYRRMADPSEEETRSILSLEGAPSGAGAGEVGLAVVPKTETSKARGGAGGSRRKKNMAAGGRKGGAVRGGDKVTSIRKSCDFCNKRKKKCHGDGVNPCRYSNMHARIDEGARMIYF